MPIIKSGNEIQYNEPINKKRADKTHVFNKSGFAVCDDKDPLKQIKLDPSGQTTDTDYSIKSPSISADIEVTMPSDAGNLGLINQQTIEYAEPTAGGTVNVSANTTALTLKPAGTLATLTINLQDTPPDGHKISIMSTEIVTALTLGTAGDDSIVGGASALAANTPIAYVYRAADTTWYRCA